MARGPKKHIKRIGCPRSWMLDKVGGIMTVRPSQGPHKLRECLPLFVLIRHRLKYALNYRETTTILKDKEANVRVDGKIRRDRGYPTGIMDVVSLEKTSENFRILYDTKGRFLAHPLKDDEAKFKLCKIVNKAIGPNKIPYVTTHDARTIRFPNPNINVNDSIKYDIATGAIQDWVKLDLGNTVYITAGNNIGRVGIVTHIEKHLGIEDVVHIKDANQKVFSTRISNVFAIGKGKKSWISIPNDKGLYLNALEQQQAKKNAEKKK